MDANWINNVIILIYCMTGLTAARNMMGKNEEINTVPFFWTMQHGKSIRYCGRYITLI